MHAQALRIDEPPPAGFDERRFRRALGRFATGVVVISTGSGERLPDAFGPARLIAAIDAEHGNFKTRLDSLFHSKAQEAKPPMDAVAAGALH